jgi:hypothetical protein
MGKLMGLNRGGGVGAGVGGRQSRKAQGMRRGGRWFWPVLDRRAGRWRGRLKADKTNVGHAAKVGIVEGPSTLDW